MGVIMKNGISYGGGSGGSGTVADTSHIELTFAEYKELEANGKVDPKATYFITDENMNGNNNVDNLVELTQAKYDELGDVVNSDNKTYYITDAEEELDASMITFDDTETQLGVNNVQDAIVEQNKNMVKYADRDIKFSDLTWNTSGSGMYYSSDIEPTNGDSASLVLGATIKGFTALRSTDNIIPIISSDGKKIRLLSNVNTFASTTSNVIVRVIYRN